MVDDDAEVVSTGRNGVGVLEGRKKSNADAEERMPMKRYLKFAASFWVSAFLVTGSMALAQSAPSAKTKKKTTTATNTNGSTQSATAPAATSSTPQTAVAHDQASGTATTSATTPATSTAPKMVVGPDKHMIPAPQI